MAKAKVAAGFTSKIEVEARTLEEGFEAVSVARRVYGRALHAPVCGGLVFALRACPRASAHRTRFPCLARRARARTS